MKDYEQIVIWLDYFNKNLKKSHGRRVGLKKCVFDPTLKELVEAAKAGGLEITESDDKVRFPRRPFVRSGYVIVPKNAPKTKILDKISESLVARRSKKSR